MDIFSLALPGLVALGFINVLTFFKPDMDSKVKFAGSAVVAFIVLFVPPVFSNMLADNIKNALAVAFAVSGTYKLAQKIGGQ
jgi:hypothetical protein